MTDESMTRGQRRLGRDKMSAPGMILAMIVWACAAVALLESRSYAQQEAAYETAVQNVTRESVAAMFNVRESSTSESGVALDWRGASSELLWVDCTPGVPMLIDSRSASCRPVRCAGTASRLALSV
jgi:hypothetical protein